MSWEPRTVVVTALICSGLACPIRYDPQVAYDCGKLSGKGAILCEHNSDCEQLPGDWDCSDGLCLKGCPQGFVCAADGYCKASSKACEEEEFRCGSHCIPTVEVARHSALCCGGCEGGKSCCPFREVDGTLVDNEVTCLDLQNDNRNCGQCGQRCEPGQSCGNGSCLSLGSCVQPGDCGHPDQNLCCGSAGGGIGTCYDRNSTDRHCGFCDNDCTTSGRICSGGSCISGRDHDCCGHACTDCSAVGQYCDGSSRSCQNCDVLQVPDRCGPDHSCSLIHSSGSNGRCVPQDSTPAAFFAACSVSGATHNCAAGSECYNLGASAGHCLPLCGGSRTCPNGSECLTGPSEAVGNCLPRCPCPAAFATDFTVCQVQYANDGSCAPGQYCFVPGSAAPGSSCETQDCADGLTCAVQYDGDTGNYIDATCRDSCSAASSCATGSCQLLTDCNDNGFCQ